MHVGLLSGVYGLLLESLSIDFTTLMDQAFTLVNSMWPIFVVPIGFALGIGLIGWIASEIKKVLPK